MFRIITSLVIFVIIIGTVRGQDRHPTFECPSTNTEFFRDPSDRTCNRYISCYREIPWVISCPRGLRFDPANLQCVMAEDVDCPICPTTGITTVKISCEQYVLCVYGTPINKTCLDGTQFDEEEGECYPGSDCPFVPCAGINTTGIHFHRDRDCRTYHICRDGLEIGSRMCPENTFFNTKNDANTCTNVEPEECAAPTPAPPPVNLPQGQGGSPTRAPRAARASFVGYCPLDGVTMMAVPGICNKYAICVDNQQFEFDCPEGTLFSAEEKLCTLPEFAKCM